MTDSISLIPVLVYDDIPAAHDFLVQAFGFRPGRVDRDGDGNPIHGEVHTGGATIWLHRATAEHALASPSSLPLQSSGLVVDVADVEAHHARASAAGARVGGPPTDQPYGRREYEARDPEGHRWWFGTPHPPQS